jgi:uncharacterized protein
MLGVVMAYGLFPFTLDTAAFDELVRDTSYKHPSHDVVGARPRSQFTGPGEETITITGAIYPTFAGSPLSLDALRAMADEGKAWPLVSGYGYIFGAYVITSVNETRAVHTGDGIPQKITFRLSLKRTEETWQEAAGLMADNVRALAGGLL